MKQDDGAEWRRNLYRRIADALRNARRPRSAQEVADETARLGYPLTRSQIANLESGRKQSLDIAELLILAAAVRVSPIALLFGGHPEADVDALPRRSVPALAAAAWFADDPDLFPLASGAALAELVDADSPEHRLISETRSHVYLVAQVARLREELRESPGNEVLRGVIRNYERSLERTSADIVALAQRVTGADNA